MCLSMHPVLIRDGEVLFWSQDGTADFINLKVVERIRNGRHASLFAELAQLA